MPDFFKKMPLEFQKNALFYFKQNVQTLTLYAHINNRICLQTLQNSFPSLTMKFSSGNCRTRSCNGTFTVSLFPRRLYLPEVDCSDRSLAIDDGTGLSCKFVADAILAEQEKELPADHPYPFFFRWC